MSFQYPPPPYYMPPVPPYERQPSWYKRRKVLILGGCALALFLLLAVLAGLAAIGFGIISLVKSSGAYQDALTRAQRDERVRAALGEPVEPGWLVTGHVESSGASESANLVIPLSGPRGAGTLYLNAARAGDTWRYTVLEVEVKQSGERISLLQDAPDGHGLPPGEALPAEPAPDELPSQPQ